jgi:hypothetical protein
MLSNILAPMVLGCVLRIRLSRKPSDIDATALLPINAANNLMD